MKTLGEKRVIVDFNPDNNEKVHQIKSKGAELINLIDSIIEPGERSEAARQVNLAITAIEVGCMHGVKANFIQD